MKRLFIGFALMNGLMLGAQTPNVQLQWTDQHLSMSNAQSLFVPAFRAEYFMSMSGNRAVEATVVIKHVQGSSVRIASQNLQAIDLSKYKDLDTQNIPSSIDPKIKVYTNKGMKTAVVAFNPIIKSGSGYSKVTNI